jgi:ComEC/Rec2-related protein
MKLLNGPRQPLVGVALAIAAGILAADWLPVISPVALVAVAVFAAATMRWARCRTTYALIIATAFLAHSVNVRQAPGRLLADRLGDHPRAVSATGVVVSEPKVSSTGFSTFLLRLNELELEGDREPCSARVSVRWRGTAGHGDTIRILAMAEPIEPPRNPGEFDMRAYLARRDVHTQFFARYAEDGAIVHHGSGNPILAAAQKSRLWIQSVLSRGLGDSPDVQALINGMVLGVRHESPGDIEQPFQQTGTLHLFAVAGLHVGIVAQLLWVLATALRIPRKWATALIIPALLFYSAITGLHTSSVRAALMASVLLAGYFIERKVLSLNSLAAAAVLILCYDTQQLFATGFQLSFAVVGAIIVASDPVAVYLARWTQSDPFLPPVLFGPVRRLVQRITGWIVRAFSVSLAAWAGSLPLIYWYFYLVAPVALLANLAVVPIAFFVLATAMLSLMAAPVSAWLSLVFTNANWCLGNLIIGIVHLFAQLPLGHFYIERPHWPTHARAEITVLDAGAGAAVHFRARGADWMFDAGSQRDYERLTREYLHSRGVDSIRGLLLSHGDSKHIGGASPLIADFRPGLILDSPARDRSRIHNALIAQLAAMHQGRLPIGAGDRLMLSRSALAEVVYPPRGFSAKRTDDQAVVVRLSIATKQHVLVMSDSGITTERALMSSGRDLHSDVLIKGQHHYEPSCSAEFLNAVRPAVIVATSRSFPPNERLDDDWAAMVQARGIKLFRQDESGAVRLRFFHGHWDAVPYMRGSAFTSSSR